MTMSMRCFLMALITLCIAFSARAEGVYTVKEATSLIEQALIKQTNAAAIHIQLNNIHPQDEALSTAAEAIEAELGDISVDTQHHLWQASILLRTEKHNLAPVSLSGHYEEMVRLPMVKHNVQASEVISENDIGWILQPASHVRKNMITSEADLVGKSAKHVISDGRAIRRDEVGGQTVLSKGTRITLLFATRNIEIKTIGEAMENGGKGDVIRVRNLASKTIVQGTVESSNVVRVMTTESLAAEAL